MADDKENQSIKYRLIGALVIVISFTLAWLLLLDHDVKRKQQWAEDVPPPIEIERFEVPEPILDTPAAQVSTPAIAQVESTPPPKPVIKPKPVVVPKAKSKPAKIKKKKPVYTQLNKKGLPDAWVLQVASFKEKANAKKLQQKLLKQGFPAYIKAFNLSSGRIYRILIGPKMSKSKVAAMAKKVEKKLGLKTMLVEYKPGFEE